MKRKYAVYVKISYVKAEYWFDSAEEACKFMDLILDSYVGTDEAQVSMMRIDI